MVTGPKSGRSERPTHYFFVQQTCQNITRTIRIAVLKYLRWVIPQDNSMVHQIWSN